MSVIIAVHLCTFIFVCLYCFVVVEVVVAVVLVLLIVLGKALCINIKLLLILFMHLALKFRKNFFYKCHHAIVHSCSLSTLLQLKYFLDCLTDTEMPLGPLTAS